MYGLKRCSYCRLPYAFLKTTPAIHCITSSFTHSLQARGLNPRPSCCEATVLLHRCVAVMTSYEPLYFVSLWNLWCLFLNKGAKFMLIFLSIFCPLHAFSHEGIEQGTNWPVKDQRKSSSAHKGPFGHLLTGEGSSTAVMTVPQAPPGLTKPHDAEKSLSGTRGCSVCKFPEGSPGKDKSLLLSVCVTLEHYFAVMLWL